jgi:hypothetical protein
MGFGTVIWNRLGMPPQAYGFVLYSQRYPQFQTGFYHLISWVLVQHAPVKVIFGPLASHGSRPTGIRHSYPSAQNVID